MAFGLGVLRLAPDVFWRMTPRELALAVEGVAGPTLEPPGRETLAALMRRFPDDRHP